MPPPPPAVHPPTNGSAAHPEFNSTRSHPQTFPPTNTPTKSRIPHTHMRPPAHERQKNPTHKKHERHKCESQKNQRATGLHGISWYVSRQQQLCHEWETNDSKRVDTDASCGFASQGTPMVQMYHFLWHRNQHLSRLTLPTNTAMANTIDCV
jgi:hypothetical protein